MSLKAGEPPEALVILGHPVGHSLSPLFQNAALHACGLNLKYSLLDTSSEGLAPTVESLRRTKTGGNVTIPHKEAMALLCDWRSPVAERTGAVNTFWFEHAKLCGHNTDVDGVRATVSALLSSGSPVSHLEASCIVLLGAGGSAAAALVAIEELRRGDAENEQQSRAQLRLAGANKVVIAARNERRAELLLERTQVEGVVVPFGSHALTQATQQASLVINCTPLGLQDSDPLPLDIKSIAGGAALFDLVYRRGTTGGTSWVKQARAHGLIAEDGLRMLIEQGACAFETWFGVEAPRDVMWGALGIEKPSPFGVRA